MCQARRHSRGHDSLCQILTHSHRRLTDPVLTPSHDAKMVSADDGFKQIRSNSEAPRPWSRSVEVMQTTYRPIPPLRPLALLPPPPPLLVTSFPPALQDVLLHSPATLTSVLISSFEAHPRTVQHFVSSFLDPRSCPILTDITIVADYRQSGEEILAHNPNVVTTSDDRVRVIFPNVPEARGGRLKHGIHHTKIMLLCHGPGEQRQRGWLQIVIASCNLSSWLHNGDILWMSPPLEEVQYNMSRVLPLTPVGLRVGHSLFRTISELVAAVPGVEGDPSTDKREWAR